MNTNDAEIVWSILNSHGYSRTSVQSEADVWLIVTCSIREGAERKIWAKLQGIKDRKQITELRPNLKVALLGCMAERLKSEVLEKQRVVDVVAGPDAYRDLPRLLAVVNHQDRGQALNVLLSLEETYADVMPMRLNENSVTGFVSIQRGCDNMCSYCIVPFTRGRERSRPVTTILSEAQHLIDQGVKEITLLGQNVNSYRDVSQTTTQLLGDEIRDEVTRNAPGFKTIYKPKIGGLRFADLLEKVADLDPEVRIRFTSPHPKDFPKEVLEVINDKKNICKNIHLPAQCGSTRILEAMRRGYTREAYLELVDQIRAIIPNVTLSSDFIAGFCGETEDEFKETLSLIEQVRYHSLFLFGYSLRDKTHAHRRLEDNVPLEVKNRRTRDMVLLYRRVAEELHRQYVGTVQTILVDGKSKRSPEDIQGRIDGNTKVICKAILPNGQVLKDGDYWKVLITDSNSQVLKGKALHSTTLADS